MNYGLILDLVYDFLFNREQIIINYWLNKRLKYPNYLYKDVIISSYELSCCIPLCFKYIKNIWFLCEWNNVKKPNFVLWNEGIINDCNYCVNINNSQDLIKHFIDVGYDKVKIIWLSSFSYKMSYFSLVYDFGELGIKYIDEIETTNFNDVDYLKNPLTSKIISKIKPKGPYKKINTPISITFKPHCSFHPTHQGICYGNKNNKCNVPIVDDIQKNNLNDLYKKVYNVYQFKIDTVSSKSDWEKQFNDYYY